MDLRHPRLSPSVYLLSFFFSFSVLLHFKLNFLRAFVIPTHQHPRQQVLEPFLVLGAKPAVGRPFPAKWGLEAQTPRK